MMRISFLLQHCPYLSVIIIIIIIVIIMYTFIYAVKTVGGTVSRRLSM